MTLNTFRSRRRHKEQTMEEDYEDKPSTSFSHPPTPSEDVEFNEQNSEDVNSRRCPRSMGIQISSSSSSASSSTVTSPEDDVNTAIMRRRRFVKNRRRRDEDEVTIPESFGSLPAPPSTTLLLMIFLCAAFQPVASITELRCGPVDIRNKPWQFRQQWSRLGDPHAENYYNKSVVDCTVVEGSFALSFIYNYEAKFKMPGLKQSDYPVFPNLREITGTLLVFETSGLQNLAEIFPNLRVIGGQALIQHYALIVYRNNDLHTIGLTKLSVIRNGGIRIQDNKLLCHSKTIEWKNMVMSPINDVIVDNAAETAIAETGKICPKGHCEVDKTQTLCRYLETAHGARVQSCWTNTTCHRRCDHEMNSYGVMGPGCDPEGRRCHEECLGGCDVAGSARDCSACRNVHYNGKCVKECDKDMYVLMGRRCVTKAECLSFNPVHANKTVPIKATAGLCSDRCPHGWEINKKDPTVCRKCDGRCEITCEINHSIDSFPKAQAIKRCHIIEGNLTIEMRGKQDTGMAAELKEVFANIHTITGYLSIQRSTPFLSLEMFKSLKKIEARWLLQGEYAISVVENHNLRKLFSPGQQITFGRNATIQVHNNRMLCFSHVRELLTMLKISGDQSHQSYTSNGDKAICDDMRLYINASQFGSDYIQFEWTSFNTTDMDHRKFLGYELYWKEVPAIDPKMSIDDDRSACVDSWSSEFVQHHERNDGMMPERMFKTLDVANHRIRPNTIYAFYVATQMVHHEGAKNGISKIGFVTTSFSQPEAPILTIVRSSTDSIIIAWDPPHQPNGEITTYTVSWRELDIKVHELAQKFCTDENTRNKDDLNADYEPIDEDNIIPEEKSVTVSTIAPKDPQTCSAMAGCCECSATGSPFSAESTIAAITDTTSFENELMDAVILQRCDSQKDPMGCALRSRPPEQEIIQEDGEDGDDDAETRQKRDAEAMERGRRRLLFDDDDTHGIRSSRRQYEQFTALIKDARFRRSIQNAQLANEQLEKEENAEKTAAASQQPKKKPKKPIHVTKSTTSPTTTISPASGTTEPPKVVEEAPMVANSTTKNISVNAKPTGNMYEITGLKHFTYYGIAVSACQNPKVPGHQCSQPYKAGLKKRTLFLDGVDVVDNSTIRAVQSGNVSQVHVYWKDVEGSNGGIRGYDIKLINVETDLVVPKCLGALTNKSGEIGVVFNGLPGGTYRVQIIATSMKGAGPESNSPEMIEVIVPGFFSLQVIIGLLCVFVCLAIIISYGVYHYVQIHYGKKVKALADFMHLNPEYAVDSKYLQDDWELDPATVILGEQCGEGSFGRVYLGRGLNIDSLYGCNFGPCAIKINQSDSPNAAENNMNYLMEANIMKNFKTNFIVKLYGVISTVDPAWVVMEVMELGNLRDYLRAKREDGEFNEEECEYFNVVPREKFCEWAAQISDGMAYLESLKFCHRDLAARNCMINSQETVKIGDFGMARDLFYHDYYKPSGKRMMPVRWMSPESLKDGKFDSKSDVWSFGVVLYEMVTLGAQPYIGLSNDEVLNFIGMARKVIKKPECCSDYWYKIMKMCWRYSPRDRPTFLQLVHLLSAEASADFKEKSFVLTENQMAMEDAEPLDLDQIDDYIEPEPPAEVVEGGAEPQDPSTRRNTDSIPMKEFKMAMSPSTLSVDAKPSRQRSADDEYTLMNHSRGPSDNEVRTIGVVDGDYVERDVQHEMPTRRNTGASNSSYTGGPYCLANRGGSNERAGFGEGLRLTDRVGSGHLHDDEYAEKDLTSSMDTRRSTGASTASYGMQTQPTNWSGNRGATYYANKQQQQQQAAAQQQANIALLNGGRGDRLTQLPGTQHIQKGRDDDYIMTSPRNNGSPSRNGNTGPNRGSFNGRSGFGENERLIEDSEHPLA